MKCDEIFAALAMLEKERGISQTFMMDKIVQALTTAYKRDHEGVENVVVDVDEAKRDLKMYVQKEVVEEVENPGTQMSLEDAKKLSAKYEVGSIVNLPVDNVEFGRIAAGNGKQVIIQGLREAESGMVYEEYNSKQHEILTGVVTRIDPRNGSVALRIGTGAEATDAILTAGEQVKGETLVEGQRIKVYLVDVRRQSRGPQVVISRTHPGLVKRLFELEVPEIYDGTVEIRGGQVHRPGGGQPHEDGGVEQRRQRRSHRRLRRSPRPAREQHRGGAARREDRHHQVQRRPRGVHRRGARARRRGRGLHGRGRQQGLPRHRAGRPALSCHRQGVIRRGGSPVQKVKKLPQRQCVGCRERKEKRELIRVVRSPEGGISLDFKGKKPGRGAYLCPDLECLKRARKSRALERALETAITPELYDELEREMVSGG